MNKPTSGADRQSGFSPLDRREFLIGGSVSLAALMLLPGAAAARSDVLRIGFIAGSGQARSLDYVDALQILEGCFGHCSPARHLPVGGNDLGSSEVRLSIIGLVPQTNPPVFLSLPSIELDIPMGAEATRFRAWGSQSEPVPQCSRATSVVLPLDDLGGVTLELVVESRRRSAHLSLSGAGGYVLQRGIYAISLDDSAPNLAMGTPPLVLTVDAIS